MKALLVVLVSCLILVGIAARRCKLGIHNLPDPNHASRVGWAPKTTEAQCLRCGTWFCLAYSSWMPTVEHVTKQDLAIQKWAERKDREAALAVATWLNRGGQKRVVELPSPTGPHPAHPHEYITLDCPDETLP